MSVQQPLSLTRRARMSVAERLLFGAAARLRFGALEIRMPGQPPRLFSGPEPGPTGVLEIRDRQVFRRLLSRGDLGFAEAYIAGEWTSPDLTTLLMCLGINLDSFQSMERGRAFLRWGQALYQRLARRNHRAGSRRNIAYHYDLGNDFYSLWLDPAMTYSAANYPTGKEDLTTAQLLKYDRLLAKTGAGPGDHILEVGCGWGGFAIRAAQTLGCRVTGITVSREQLAWARQRAEEAGVSHRVEFLLQDYRDLREQFDHIISIEMFEAVGEAYWSSYFQVLRNCLRPGGRVVLQIITIDEQHFERYRKDVDFIRKYIFPGGVLPSPDALAQCYQSAGFHASESEFRGRDYARTLSLWAQRFEASRAQVSEQGFGEDFLRMWHYYLAYCEAGFLSGRIDLLQTVLALDADGERSLDGGPANV
jgi:cyclopropane-fatty-acyl-phospholipid synthase